MISQGRFRRVALSLPVPPAVVTAVVTAVALVGALAAGPAGATGDSRPAWELELEAGPVWQTVNDQQIPNNPAGTRFSLVDLVGRGPQTAYRAYATWRLDARHSLRALWAPLSFTEPGRPAAPIEFNGDSFTADTPVQATYRFNSYRLTYAYLWRDGPRWRWQVGLTAKIRDARVRLRQGVVVSTKDDVGFVPLLHVAGRRRLGERWHLDVDLDALAGGPGRAEDLAVKLGYDPIPCWHLRAGYRMLEGGADVDAVYSFAWLHYAVASARLAF